MDTLACCFFRDAHFTRAVNLVHHHIASISVRHDFLTAELGYEVITPPGFGMLDASNNIRVIAGYESSLYKFARALLKHGAQLGDCSAVSEIAA